MALGPDDFPYDFESIEPDFFFTTASCRRVLEQTKKNTRELEIKNAMYSTVDVSYAIIKLLAWTAKPKQYFATNNSR